MAIRKSTKDKQRSTKHKHKTKDRVSRTSLKPGMNSGAPSLMRIMVCYLIFNPAFVDIYFPPSIQAEQILEHILINR